ncbi:F-box only protein 32-like isoform X1 [Lethenteron reissneri]|uniref:F-box only protein 32-like isoform X1 n=1 Tax=Lethenteron reissneri TaxID=7753 RepID=UPI002AB78BB9|nr:F-box only protein 32-like isoform X1 [Lethenteron reissneri]XP_061425333.1 F-box only protein 32-like isoform X1 [Lethenteron reissneri]
MPFLGQDWRAPGDSWFKTRAGWKRYSEPQLNGGIGSIVISDLGEDNRLDSLHASDGVDKENERRDCINAAKKRRKENANNNVRTQYFHKDKWIYVHKGSTKERHGYCTLGEAFNRLDFSSAIQDTRRFHYVVRLLQLIADTQLTSLSGVAQTNYFSILERVVCKVVDDQHSMRPIRELLSGLCSSVARLVCGVGKSPLVGNVNTWTRRLDTILLWQRLLCGLQISRRGDEGLTLSDLPPHTQLSILQRLDDGRDIVSLGRVTATLHSLSEDRMLWRTLCRYHFTDKQFCRHLVVREGGSADWKATYFTLQKLYPRREQYADSLQFCRHCSILFWKDYPLAVVWEDTGHPCSANDPETSFISVSPQDFMKLFRY